MYVYDIMWCIFCETLTKKSVNTTHYIGFGHVQRMEENRISKRVLYINLETKRLRGKPRNRCQNEMRMEE
jgi:hypothetical protein